MTVDISEYRKATRLSNILDVISEDVLATTLAGYSHIAFSGAARYYKTCIGEPKEAGDIEFLNAGGDSAKDWYHPFCKFYRYACRQDAKCLEFDKRVTLDFYKNLKKNPMLYQCHRDVWDMVYPLRINEQLVGVLFGGQMIVKRRNVVWRRELDEIYQYVCWDYSDSDDNHPFQIEDIVNSLRKDGEISKKQISEAQDILVREDPVSKKNYVTVPALVKRLQDFLQFGKTIESLLAPLYEANVQAAVGSLLSDMATELAKSATSEQWWETLVDVVNQFQAATEVGEIDIYIRRHSNFIQEVNSSGLINEGREKERVPVNVCIELPNDELVNIDESELKEQLREYFEEPIKYLYSCEVAGFRPHQHLCTLIAVHSLGSSESIRDFTKEFCSMVSLRANIERALNQIETEQEEYKKRV